MKWGTLDLDTDDGIVHDPATIRSTTGYSAMNRRDLMKKEDTRPVLPAIGRFAHCWCGEPQGHSWPGDKNGAPHPR